MKVIINRQLIGGQYIVRFGVSDFTADELAKMNSFGVPGIQIRQGQGRVVTMGLTQINPNTSAANFTAEKDANDYEQAVMEQIRQAMILIRDRKDDFSSTQEVNI